MHWMRWDMQMGHANGTCMGCNGKCIRTCKWDMQMGSADGTCMGHANGTCKWVMRMGYALDAKCACVPVPVCFFSSCIPKNHATHASTACCVPLMMPVLMLMTVRRAPVHIH